MPDDTGTTEINNADVTHVATKLQAFAQTLPEQEQLVIDWLLTRAASGNDPEVSGYPLLGVSPAVPFTHTFNSALGLGGRVADAGTSTISWAYAIKGSFLGGAIRE